MRLRILLFICLCLVAQPVMYTCGFYKCRINVPVTRHLDIEYDSIRGVDPHLLSLDVYVPSEKKRGEFLPVIVWVHGGGWKRGDKTSTVCEKVNLFIDAGYVLVSINYRLSPEPPDTSDQNRVKYPVHPRDVAKALAFVHEHIDEYGGDPTRVALMGHSAGAHLVALVSTDESFLADNGYGTDIISCTLSLDVDAYDIPLGMKNFDEEMKEIFINAFGTDRYVWERASPVNHIEAGSDIPPFLLVSRGGELTREMGRAFSDELNRAGVSTSVVKADEYSHIEVDTMIGDAGDRILTPAIEKFLRNVCFSGP